MKYIIALLLTLFFSVNLLLGQKKNELHIGFPGIYLFNESPYRIHDLIDIPVPTHFKFKRYLLNRFSTSLEYNYIYVAGEKGGEIYRGRVYVREIHEFTFLFNWDIISDRKLILSLNVGPSFRYGGELFHIKFNYFNNIPWEEILDWNDYEDWGLTGGVEFRYLFSKRFNVGLDLNYTQFDTKLLPQELRTAFFVGYMF